MFNLLKNPSFLDENSRVADVFEFTSVENSFENYLLTVKDKSITAMLGKHGSGKSTALFHIEDKNKDTQRWLHFDAWKYPDRSALWEGFVLDIADQIGQRKDVVKVIDGKLTTKRVVGKTSITTLASVVSNLTQIKIIADIGKALSSLFDKSPVKRLFEIQGILKSLVDSQKLPVYIVVEDIDRADGSGVHFMETLSHFLRNNEFETQVKVIAPMDPEKYNENKSSFAKSIDNKYEFRARISEISTFIDAVFHEDLYIWEKLPNYQQPMSSGQLKEQLTEYLKGLISTGLLPRDLKSMLRDWVNSCNLLQRDIVNVDYRIVLLLTGSKYIYSRGEKEPDYNYIYSNLRFPSGSNILQAYGFAIARSSRYLKKMNTEEYDVSNADLRYIKFSTENEDAGILWSEPYYNQEGFWAIPLTYLV